MKGFVNSSDGTRVHFSVKGKGGTTLLFVHGWLGNGDWWNSQEEFFAQEYSVVTIDLPGHGKSGKDRRVWSGKQYAEDILAVLEEMHSEKVVLVGHSMAGAYVVQAALLTDKVVGMVLVDTLKNLDQLMTIQQAEERLFSFYRKDFKDAVENLLPKFLFCESTPERVRNQLQREFLENEPEFAIRLLEPLYTMDIRELATRVSVPVRAINSAYTSTALENNQKYFQDFNYVSISGTGHYPMLERPEEFNRLLKGVLTEIATVRRYSEDIMKLNNDSK